MKSRVRGGYGGGSDRTLGVSSEILLYLKRPWNKVEPNVTIEVKIPEWSFAESFDKTTSKEIMKMRATKSCYPLAKINVV